MCNQEVFYFIQHSKFPNFIAKRIDIEINTYEIFFKALKDETEPILVARVSPNVSAIVTSEESCIGIVLHPRHIGQLGEFATVLQLIIRQL